MLPPCSLDTRIGRCYYSGTYSPTHWATSPISKESPYFIARATFEKAEYEVYLNPSDCRGYRCVVSLTNFQDPQTTFNREYTVEEKVGIAILAQLIADVFNHVVPNAQIAFLGNNAHSLDKDTKEMVLGNAHEPHRLHAHIIGRGNPNKAYIGDVLLKGPVAGNVFNMRGNLLDAIGNRHKVKWKKQEAEKVAQCFQKVVERVKANYLSLGVIVDVKNTS